VNRAQREHVIRASALAHGLVRRDELRRRLDALPVDEARRAQIRAQLG
jgi:hypothetical protein